MINAFVKGDILQAQAEVLVNPVNTLGVMGAGLAKRFKSQYPEMFAAYHRACDHGQFHGNGGHGFAYTVSEVNEPRKIVYCLPTKRDWRDPSSLEQVTQGLIHLADWLTKNAIVSVAVPALGCGLGGLAWADVRPLICEYLDPLHHTAVDVYLP